MNGSGYIKLSDKVLRILKKSKIYRRTIREWKILFRLGEPFVVWSERDKKNTIWLTESLSAEAIAGIIIFELYGVFVKSISHEKHLAYAYLNSSLYEKKLIWQAALEYLGRGKKRHPRAKERLRILETLPNKNTKSIPN